MMTIRKTIQSGVVFALGLFQFGIALSPDYNIIKKDGQSYLEICEAKK